MTTVTRIVASCLALKVFTLHRAKKLWRPTHWKSKYVSLAFHSSDDPIEWRHCGGLKIK
jgi:hypothetical protein